MQHRLTDTLTPPLALGEDSLYLSAFRNLLSLTSPRAQLFYLCPLHLSLLTLSVLDLVGCVLFIFHSFTPLSIHVHYIFRSVVLFLSVSPPINVLLSSRGTVLIFCPPVSPRLISKYAVVYCAECRLCLRHQDLVLLSHPRCLFPLSVPACRVCLSALVLMDLSVVGLQHVSAVANVARDDLHLITAPR